MNWEEFKAEKEIKHNADLTTWDVLLLDNGDHFDQKDKTFDRVVCDGYCGKDEFWGFEVESGRRRSWCDNDCFKIIAKHINLTT